MHRLLRPRVVIGTVVGLIALYACFGFILIPYMIKSYVIPSASEQIKHPVVLREAAFNPFTLALRLTGLEVREQNEAPMVGFEELFVDLHVVTLFFQKVAFDEIRLVMPFVAAKIDPLGRLNLSGLAPPPDETVPTSSPSPNEPKQSMMPVEIELLEITQGIVEYRDESKPTPVVFDIVPFQVVLRNFSTIQREGENAYAFTAESGKGEVVDWEGTFSLNPVKSDGRVILSGVKLQTLYQAVQDQFQFDLHQGEVGLSGLYHLDLSGPSPQVTVMNGRFSIRNLAIAERGEIEPVMSIPQFDIEGVQVDLEKHRVDVTKVHSADARFDAWTGPDGVLNYQRLFTPIEPTPASTPSSSKHSKPDEPAKPWTVTVDEVGLKNYRASFEDRRLKSPGHIDVAAMNLTVKNVNVPFKKPLPVQLSFKLNGTGAIGVQGMVQVEPLTADADLDIAHVEIRPFQAYLDQFLNADIRDGAIDLKGVVRFAQEPAHEPMLHFQGNLGVNQLAVAERNILTDAVAWKALNINRIALDVEPTTVKIAEIVWQEPSAQIVIGADGKLNFSRLTASPPPTEHAPAKKEAEAAKAQAKPTEPVPVTVDQVKLVKLSATFEDQSIEPTVKTGLTDFGGIIKGLSSKQLKKADVDLAGKVGRSAPFKIVGKINPLSEDAFTDLDITLAGMDLRPTGPYSGKYVGYELSKGKLSIDLKYKVSQKILEAENLVHVDQLTFGEETNSPDATSLPVPLVVGLLKDRKGQIEIDMPIRGDLNDPDFKYGKVLVSTLLNLLTKVVASPFSLMGKLVPGGGENGEDLQFIEFPPGSTLLTDEDGKKLEILETVLDERAGLRLDIKGTFDAALDRTAIQTMKLREQLLEMSGKPRVATGEGLSPKDEQRLIEKLYAKLPLPDPSTTTESVQPTVEDMKQRVAAAMVVSDAEFQALARQRAEAVRKRLLESGRLTESRVTLLDSGVAESGHEKVRTQLALAAAS